MTRKNMIAAFVAAACIMSAGAVGLTVSTANKGVIYNTSPVVTNVVFDAAGMVAPTGSLATAALVYRPDNGESLRLTIAPGSTLTADTNRFLNGQSVFVAANVGGAYYVADNITLCGYGSWATNDFQAVFWRLDNKVFCNIIREGN